MTARSDQRSPERPAVPDQVAIAPATWLAGTVGTPGDKSISHRALLIGALAEGTTTIRGLSDGDDVAHTAAAVAACGADVSAGPEGTVRISGGPGRLHPPDGPIDCGNSGTGIRLLAGWLAGLGFAATLRGDESLSNRPMDRVAEPLAAMGATVRGEGDRCQPPLRIEGRTIPLRGIDWPSPVVSAQVKSAILFAGLRAEGETVVREAVTTRRHTEEMLAAAGAQLSETTEGRHHVVRLWPSTLRPLDLTVPGDPSQAAFWLVAGTVVAGSALTVRHVYLGPERTGFVEVLRRMGADLEVTETGNGAGDLAVRAAPLTATIAEAAEIPSLDEVPALAVAAACATGTTVFRNMGELRVKEVDRLAAVVALVRAFGAAAEAVDDDLWVHGVGPGQLTPGRFDSGGDHRMAMAAAVAALACERSRPVPGAPLPSLLLAGDGAAPELTMAASVIDGFSSVVTSYPGFLDDLVALGGPGLVVSPEGWTAGRGRRSGPTRGTASARAAQPRVVAIDGPAGAGKSTVAKALADRLGLERLDTGAMYRSVAWAVLEQGIDPHDELAVAEIARTAGIEVGEVVRVDGIEVTGAIRSAPVGHAVSIVAANPTVRRHLVQRQRQWAAARGGGVVEGRDIGTVVFPEAELKVFLTASEEERVRRRRDESPEGVARRDRLDQSRAASPLVVAVDARVLDTTGRSIESVVAEVLSWL